MYTQTGRIGRKEGKIARKTKPSAAGRTAEGTSARGCLGPSDDSQSSCLLASRFPFLDGYAVYVPPASRVPPASLHPASPSPAPVPAPPLSLLSCQPLLFVAHAPMRNKHCSKMVSPDRASPAPAQVFVARHSQWPRHESFREFFMSKSCGRSLIDRLQGPGLYKCWSLDLPCHTVASDVFVNQECPGWYRRSVCIGNDENIVL